MGESCVHFLASRSDRYIQKRFYQNPVSLPEDRVGAAPGCGGIVGSIRQHGRQSGTAITLRQTLQRLGVQGALKHRQTEEGWLEEEKRKGGSEAIYIRQVEIDR